MPNKVRVCVLWFLHLKSAHQSGTTQNDRNASPTYTHRTVREKSTFGLKSHSQQKSNFEMEFLQNCIPVFPIGNSHLIFVEKHRVNKFQMHFAPMRFPSCWNIHRIYFLFSVIHIQIVRWIVDICSHHKHTHPLQCLVVHCTPIVELCIHRFKCQCQRFCTVRFNHKVKCAIVCVE